MMEVSRRPVTWEFGHLNGNIGSLLGRYPDSRITSTKQEEE